jgi:hypothetical protein
VHDMSNCLVGLDRRDGHDAVEARDLLVRRLGVERVDAEPDAVEQIIHRCARLPIALAIAAARALIGSLAGLAAELGASATRLDALDTGERGHGNSKYVDRPGRSPPPWTRDPHHRPGG